MLNSADILQMIDFKGIAGSILSLFQSGKEPIDTDSFGDWGEKTAARYLVRNGYRIIARNFRCKRGEVDIIAAEGDFLVFVEVKTRSSTLFGEPQDAVDAQKMQHLERVAYFYMRQNRLRQETTPFRFDIVSIVADPDTHRIDEIKIFKGTHTGG